MLPTLVVNGVRDNRFECKGERALLVALKEHLKAQPDTV